MTTPDDPHGPDPARGSGRRDEPSSGADEGSSRDPVAPYLRILGRALRSIRAFFAAHVIVVRSEAEREAIRVGGGVALIFGVAVFLLASALLAGAGSVALVQRLTGLPWLESIAIAMGSTLLVASFLGFLAWLRLRKPLMPESRELLQKTLDGLSGR